MNKINHFLGHGSLTFAHYVIDSAPFWKSFSAGGSDEKILP